MRAQERKKNRHDFFEKITITSKETLPYQNITLVRTRLEQRRISERNRIKKIDPIDFLYHSREEMDTVKKLEAPFCTSILEGNVCFFFFFFFFFVVVFNSLLFLLTCDFTFTSN